MLSKTLDFTSAVLRLRSAIFAANAIKGIYLFSEEEWDRAQDKQMDFHYIKGVLTSGEKSDAIIEYVGKVVRVYMGVVGAIPGTLSKESLESENAITVAIIRRMGAIKIDDNRQLFDLVASRLLGIDLDLIKASYTIDEVHFVHILKYLVGTLGEQFEEVAYNQPAAFLAKYQEAGKLNDELFEQLIAAGSEFFKENPDSDITVIDLLDDLLYNTSLGLERSAPAE